MTERLNPQNSTRRMVAPVRALLVLGLLTLFLVGVRLLEQGIRSLGDDFTDTLFQGISNPVAGLFVGVLATVLVQSSSVSTSTMVGLVAAGVLNVESAIPMIMGANIGTTVTNTLISLAHIRQPNEFRLALTAATMHDFFNLIVVAVLLPIELLTGILSTAAHSITGALFGGPGLEFNSPIKGAVKWLSGRVELLLETFISDGTLFAAILLILGIGLIFLTLALITKNMRALVARRIERSLNAVLARSSSIGMLVGILVTITVQSSSITTSILIPLVASGVLVVRNAYPITLGANIGTTITALLAALGTGSVDALTIATVHTLFNIAGILLIYSFRITRYIPVQLAENLAAVAIKHRSVALAYVVIIFIAVPLIGTVMLS